jgi:hypothetical protein
MITVRVTSTISQVKASRETGGPTSLHLSHSSAYEGSSRLLLQRSCHTSCPYFLTSASATPGAFASAGNAIVGHQRLCAGAPPFPTGLSTAQRSRPRRSRNRWPCREDPSPCASCPAADGRCRGERRGGQRAAGGRCHRRPKSVAEGIGLNVAETIWKARPIFASRTGGIQDQIEHGGSGVLLDSAASTRPGGRVILIDL